MGRDLDLDDVVAQYPEAKRELEQLRDDLAAARKEATRLYEELSYYDALRIELQTANADLAAARARVENLEGAEEDRDEYQRQAKLYAERCAESDIELEAARALPTALSDGYLAGTVSGSETAHSIRLHYRSRRQAEEAFDALTDAIDAALAGEKK